MNNNINNRLIRLSNLNETIEFRLQEIMLYANHNYYDVSIEILNYINHLKKKFVAQLK